MRALILTLGTRGDVQPFAALASALKNAGHETTVGLPEKFRSLVESTADHVIPFRDTIGEMVLDSKIRRGMECGFSGLRGTSLYIRFLFRFKEAMSQVLDDLLLATEHGADIVVFHPSIPGHAVAEFLDVPAIPASLAPHLVPTNAAPHAAFPYRVPQFLNRLTYFCNYLQPLIKDAHLMKWRTEKLGLAPRRGYRDRTRRPDGSRTTVLQAYSQNLLQATETQPVPWSHTTGFWFIPSQEEWIPPASLRKFVSSGERPVYIGFGSMVASDPARTEQIVTEAIERAGVRAVVNLGPGGATAPRSNPNILHIDDTRFDWLFPRMSALVHHGGIGTIGAALASGRPQVVCPFAFDHIYFSRRLYECGLAPAPQPQRGLSAPKLAEAIHQAVTDQGMAQRCEQYGTSIRNDGGVSAAVEILEGLV